MQIKLARKMRLSHCINEHFNALHSFWENRIMNVKIVSTNLFFSYVFCLFIHRIERCVSLITRRGERTVTDRRENHRIKGRKERHFSHHVDWIVSNFNWNVKSMQLSCFLLRLCGNKTPNNEFNVFQTR